MIMTCRMQRAKPRKRLSAWRTRTSPLNYVLAAQWNGRSAYDPGVPKNNRDIACPSAEGTTDVWVLENPKKPGQTLVTYTEPNIKYFYVLPPDEKEWNGASLMWSGDGTYASRQPLKVAPGMCGWFYAVWMDESLPENFIIFRDDDVSLNDAIGLDGLDPATLNPIPMTIIFDAYQSDAVYFIADPYLAEENSVEQFLIVDPGLEGHCTYNLAAILYDTDASLHGAFTCDAYPNVASNGCYTSTAKYNFPGSGASNSVPCIGVTTGIVNPILDATTKKPTYNSSSGCFVSQEAFNVMFSSTPGVNYQHCRDIPFGRGSDGMWKYDSYKESTGAFTILNDLITDPTCQADGLCKTAATAREGLGGILYGAGDSPTTNNISSKAQKALGTVSDWSAIEPTTGLPYIDLYPVSDGEFESGTTPNVYDNSSWALRVQGDNNQFFCMESHARFTYREGATFSIRGDDDIWVFIDNKLAIDLGGMHLPAPGYVKLDTLKGASGNLLVSGRDYDIDIFYCDRRTDMTNLRIVTNNMYIEQSTGITIDSKPVGEGTLELDICAMTIGGGDCAAAVAGLSDSEECGDNITAEVSYKILTRNREPVPGCGDCDALTPYTINHGGIDLTNPKVPRINQDKITGLAPDVYNLAITLAGKTVYHKFKVKSLVGVASSDVEFVNIDGDPSAYPTGTKWLFTANAIAGTRIPIYVSVVDQEFIDLIYAQGQSYTLTLSSGATLYRNYDDETPLFLPYHGMINMTGVDTLWVDVPLAGITGDKKEVTVSVGSTSTVLTFYAPQLTFAKPKTMDEFSGRVLEWTTMNQDPDVDEDGDEYFHWVNSDVDFYIIVRNPATGGLCADCDFALELLDASSGISGEVSALDGGVAKVRIHSSKTYDVTAASIIVGIPENPDVAAPYGNMHFYGTPAPMPVLADIFDVKGAPLGDLSIPEPYYDGNMEYLDGKADSLVVVYDRAIDPDSIPHFLCLNFDEENLKKINPYEKGISNNSKDNEMYCSTTFDAAEIRKAYDRSPDDGRTLMFSVDEPFSAKVKTHVNSENKIASFTEYVWKGRPVRTFFNKALTDRMAPVILSAQVSPVGEGTSLDRVKVIVSEPVSVADSSMANVAFDYYLNSATDFSFGARYMHVTSQNKPVSKKDTLTFVYNKADKENPTPHVGDFIRFRADEQVWTDDVDLSGDSLRPASDAKWHWNSPTDYNSTDRLPSPWVMIKGGASNGDYDNPGIDYASPSFRIKMVGPFQFAIVMDDFDKASRRSYAVMDLQGRVLLDGTISAGETLVPVLNSGSYIVKVGIGYRRVNIR